MCVWLTVLTLLVPVLCQSPCDHTKRNLRPVVSFLPEHFQCNTLLGSYVGVEVRLYTVRTATVLYKIISFIVSLVTFTVC